LEPINTVYGAISTDDLGFELMHEHVMVSGSSIWSQYPDLLDPDRAARVVVRLKEARRKVLLPWLMQRRLILSEKLNC